MNFKASKIPGLIIVLYQIVGIPILVKFMPIFMSQSHDVLESYPLFIYGSGWLVIVGTMAMMGRRQEIEELGLSSLPRTSGKGVHFPREKAWLYKDMPVSLAHPGRKGRGHVECLAGTVGSLVIFWLPRNLGTGLFVNNLEKEQKVVVIRAGGLSFGVAAEWKHEILTVQDPTFRELRYCSRESIEGVLHSNGLLKKITEVVEYISPFRGRLIIEDSLVAAYFPGELPQGDELFSRAYGLWQEVVAAQWPRRKFNPFDNWRSSVSLLLTAAVIAAFNSGHSVHPERLLELPIIRQGADGLAPPQRGLEGNRSRPC